MNFVNNRTELPIIKEEKSRENVIFDEEDHEEQFSLDLSEHNITDITNSKLISKSIFSGITICALTGASLYYYSKFRNL
jgi:3-isopropylmalate dehydratase small subunit